MDRVKTSSSGYLELTMDYRQVFLWPPHDESLLIELPLNPKDLRDIEGLKPSADMPMQFMAHDTMPCT